MQESAIVKAELIGRQVTIHDCTDPTWKNTTGMIIDETKNTFLIERNNKQRRIAKATATFAFTDHDKTIIVNGSRLTYRPEDRIKKAR